MTGPHSERSSPVRGRSHIRLHYLQAHRRGGAEGRVARSGAVQRPQERHRVPGSSNAARSGPWPANAGWVAHLDIPRRLHHCELPCGLCRRGRPSMPGDARGPLPLPRALPLLGHGEGEEALAHGPAPAGARTSRGGAGLHDSPVGSPRDWELGAGAIRSAPLTEFLRPVLEPHHRADRAR